MAQDGIFCFDRDPVLSHCYLLVLGKVAWGGIPL